MPTASRRTGTRTGTWPGRSTAGSSTCSPGEGVQPQRGWLLDPQLHPDPGDDAPRPDRRGLAPRRSECLVEDRSDDGGRGRRRRDGPGARPPRDLPDRQADLDAGVGPLQRGDLPGDPRPALRPDRCVRLRRWTYPFLVIGRNSIAAYCLAHLTGDFITGTFRTHLGSGAFQLLGERYEPLVEGASLLATYWLILFWMDRRRIYLKV